MKELAESIKQAFEQGHTAVMIPSDSTDNVSGKSNEDRLYFLIEDLQLHFDYPISAHYLYQLGLTNIELDGTTHNQVTDIIVFKCSTITPTKFVTGQQLFYTDLNVGEPNILMTIDSLTHN